jgi:hypothetical protein
MAPDSKIHKANNIKPRIPYKWILRRLGFKKNETPPQDLIKLLDMNAGGIMLNESFQLIPEKTVTAIAGLT